MGKNVIDENWIFVFSLVFPHFLGGANFGTNLGSLFLLLRAERPETHVLSRRQAPEELP